METASSGSALAESSTPLTWCTVARTGAQYVGNLTNQCFAKFTSPHPKCFIYWLFTRLRRKHSTRWAMLTSECNICNYDKDHFKAETSDWNAKAHLKTSAFSFFFLSWNDRNIDFLMKLIRVQKKKEQPNMGSNDKWDERQNISRRPPNDFTKSQIRRSDRIFSRKSQSIAIYSCLREFSPNGRASLLQGKWLRNGSLLQLY